MHNEIQQNNQYFNSLQEFEKNELPPVEFLNN